MSTVPLSVIRTTAGLVIIVTLIWSGCGDSPSEPDLPDFLLESIVFTGDSIGDAPAAAALTVATRMAAKGEPYCEVTVSWVSPYHQRVVSYSVHRALSPGIPSGAVDYRTLGTTAMLNFPDSDSLSWGTTYYYAVSALLGDSTLLWSDEQPFTTPTTDYPIPSILDVDDLLMGQCLLHWSACPDQDFSSYTVVVRLGLYSPEDTIGVYKDVNDTLAVSAGNPDFPVYFQVTTTDAEGHASKSNMVPYEHNGELPWKLGRFVHLFPDYPCHNMGMLVASHCGRYLYFSDRTGWGGYVTSGINRISTTTGTYRRQTSHDLSAICHVSSRSGVLVSYDDTDGMYLDLLDESTLHTVSSLPVDFTCSAMIAGEMDVRVILCPEGSQTSLVLDMNSMSFVDTLDFTFSHGQCLGGYGTYIWGGTEGLCRLDPATLNIAASNPIALSSNPLITSEGDLCVISGTNDLYWLNPFSLDLLDSRQLPVWPVTSVLTEASGTVYIYYPKGNSWVDSIMVMNSNDFTITGKICLPQEIIPPSRMLFLPDQDQIWFLFWMDPFDPGYLSIIR